MKTSHSTQYWAALGFVSEIDFSAIGMKPPGFASAAPAPTMAIAGDDASLPIWSIMLCSFFGSTGLRNSRRTQTSSTMPATTSMIATHVFGLDGVLEAATFPRTNAARIPIETVAVKAPSQNQMPVRSGRFPRTSASTENDTVVGETIAARETSTSSE